MNWLYELEDNMVSARFSKALLSLVLSLVVTSFYAFSSFAASNAKAEERSVPANSINNVDALIPAELQDQPSGVVSGTGLITVNGHPTRSGATILTGNAIGTGSDGNALIDLGPLGRVRLQPNSSVEVMFTAEGFRLKTICENTRVEVTSGKIDVRSSPVRTLVAGDQDTLKSGSEITAAMGSYLVIDCSPIPPSSTGYLSGGAPGTLILIGLAGATAAGIAIGSGNKPAAGRASGSPTVP